MEARLKALETALPNLATKSDLKAEVADLRADFAALRGDMKGSVADLRADMHKVDAEHKKWIMTTVFAVIGSGVAVAGFLFATLRQPQPPPQSAAQQPIIINVPGIPAPPATPGSATRP